jgi:hypothetical protein
MSSFKPGEHVADIKDLNRVREWGGNQLITDAAGNPLILFHRTTEQFEQLDPARTRDGGIHFGHSGQALMRAGKNSHVFRVALKASKVRRCKDTGGNWKARIAAAKKAGADAIVYLNRYEGMTTDIIERLQQSGDLHRLDGLSDTAFLRLVPEAQDSYIVWDLDQIHLF